MKNNKLNFIKEIIRDVAPCEEGTTMFIDGSDRGIIKKYLDNAMFACVNKVPTTKDMVTLFSSELLEEGKLFISQSAEVSNVEKRCVFGGEFQHNYSSTNHLSEIFVKDSSLLNIQAIDSKVYIYAYDNCSINIKNTNSQVYIYKFNSEVSVEGLCVIRKRY